MSRANPRFKRTNPPLTPIGSNTTGVYIIQGTIEGQETLSSFQYSTPASTVTQSQIAILLGALNTAFTAKYLACCSGDWTMVRQLFNITSVNSIIGQVTQNSVGTAGTGGAGHMPTEIAAFLVKYSGVKGQHGRGRLSMPGVPLLAVTQSKVTLAANLAAYTALANQMLLTASDGTNTWTPAITTRSPASPKLVIAFTPLLTVVLNPLVGTIRRRRVGRGK
jgi:hypothetical protein